MTTETTGTTGTQTEPRRAGRREWIGLAALALPCVVYAMDLTVLNLALPTISRDLRPSSSELLWIVDIYGFLVAGLLVTMGTLGDWIGRRRVLLAGAATFAAASVAAAFAHSAPMLIAARAVLGVAGATLAPSTLSLIRTMFADPRQRTIAIGIPAASFSVGGAIGPVLGGVVLHHAGWGAVFLLAVPVMVGFIVIAQVGTLGLPAVVAGSAVLYLGLGPVYTLCTDVVISAAPAERAGAAAALSETCGELGGALGIAVLGSVGTAVYRGGMADLAIDAPPAALTAAHDTLGGAAATAAQLPQPVAAQLLDAARGSFTHTVSVVATICAIVAAAAAVTAVVMLRQRSATTNRRGNRSRTRPSGCVGYAAASRSR